MKSHWLEWSKQQSSHQKDNNAYFLVVKKLSTILTYEQELRAGTNHQPDGLSLH